jgi:hypothetical protein
MAYFFQRYSGIFRGFLRLLSPFVLISFWSSSGNPNKEEAPTLAGERSFFTLPVLSVIMRHLARSFLYATTPPITIPSVIDQLVCID